MIDGDQHGASWTIDETWKLTKGRKNRRIFFVWTSVIFFRRLAEVWLDEYKKFFYEIAPDAKQLDMGSIEEQLANKKRLNCKPFKYFITDVVKDMYPPTLLSYTKGGLSPTTQSEICLDTYAHKSGDIKLYGCHHMGGNQAISLTEKGELRINILTCLESVSKDTGVYMSDCNGNGNQIWSHKAPNSR